MSTTLQRPLTGTALLAGLALLTSCGTGTPAKAPVGPGAGPATSTSARPAVTTAALGAATAVPATAAVVSGVGVAATGAAGPPGAAPASPDHPGPAVTPAAAPAGRAVTACSVITRQDVRSVLGADPGAGTSETSHTLSGRCVYNEKTSAVLVFVISGGFGASYFNAFPARMEASGAGDPVNLPGVGDRAYGVFHPGGSSIVFRKGSVVVTASVLHPLDHSTSRAQVVALAKIAASRL